jgi:hypothetical protein
MRTITNLPVEIIYQFQQYFFTYVHSQTFLYSDSFSETNMDEMEFFFLHQESNRSWRNFLNISQKEHWQLVKKSTVIWSLNTFASRKYLDELPFRNYISQRMTNPGMQLILRIPDVESPKRITSVEQGLTMNSIGFLSLHSVGFGISVILHLPSCASLQALFLDNCPGLISLGEYKNLKTLKVNSCPNLSTAGKMETLTTFYARVVRQSFLKSLSTESLTNLTLYSHIDYFRQNMNSFLNLRELILFLSVIQAGINSHLPQLPLPLLEKLTTRNYLSLDITGLYHLQSLDIGSTVTSAVKGKEEIFPRLTSLSGSGDAFLEEDIRNYPQLKSFSYQSMSQVAIQNLPRYENIADINLSCKAAAYGCIMVNLGQNTRSYELNLKGVDVVVENQNLEGFGKVSISSPTLRNLSIFQNVQRLSLTNCFNLTDISAIGNVPYLSLEKCRKVTDFSCLVGQQRFLNIAECPGLNDVDIQRFGNIYHLGIKNCANITKIDGLINNHFISISECYRLSEVMLSGINYTKVLINRNDSLTNLSISGKVYSLQISCCSKLDEDSLQNYEYLKFEKHSLALFR